MQHADRKCVIKDAREGQVVDVCLDDVRVRQIPRRGKGSLNRIAKIDSDNISRAKLGRELRMSSLPATAFEHNFVFEEFAGDRSNPGQKLVFVTSLKLIEVLPLPTKFLGGGCLVLLHFVNRGKARHSTHDGPGVITRLTVERGFHDFRLLAHNCGANANARGARWTNEIMN